MLGNGARAALPLFRAVDRSGCRSAFLATRSRVYVTVGCPSVRLSVCLFHHSTEQRRSVEHSFGQADIYDLSAKSHFLLVTLGDSDGNSTLAILDT